MDIVEQCRKAKEYNLFDADVYEQAAAEIEQLREDLKDQKGKTIAVYKREAKWIENVSNAKVEIERLQNERDLFKGIWQKSTELDHRISEAWTDETEKLQDALREVSGYVARAEWFYITEETKAVVKQVLGKEE